MSRWNKHGSILGLEVPPTGVYTAAQFHIPTNCQFLWKLLFQLCSPQSEGRIKRLCCIFISLMNNLDFSYIGLLLLLTQLLKISAQGLERWLSALAQDPGSVPSTFVAAHYHL